MSSSQSDDLPQHNCNYIHRIFDPLTAYDLISSLGTRGLLMFHQNSAPAHRARETIKLLQRETPAFISPDLWPPNSPDPNPVNYKICGVMQDRVYQKKSEGRERVKRATG